MKFDKQKWDAYVQEQGGNEVLAKKAIENKVINCCYLYDDAFDVFNGYEFDPLENTRHIGLFMALDLDITDFILPEPIQTVTGIETLRALCDGKVVRDIETDALYKIENNIYLIYHGNGAWDKAHIDISFLLLDKFEVIDAENN